MTTLKDLKKCIDTANELGCVTKWIENFEKETTEKMNRLMRMVLNWRTTTWKSDMDKTLRQVIEKWNKEEILG